MRDCVYLGIPNCLVMPVSTWSRTTKTGTDGALTSNVRSCSLVRLGSLGESSCSCRVMAPMCPCSAEFVGRVGVGRPSGKQLRSLDVDRSGPASRCANEVGLGFSFLRFDQGLCSPMDLRLSYLEVFPRIHSGVTMQFGYSIRYPRCEPQAVQHRVAKYIRYSNTL